MSEYTDVLERARQEFGSPDLPLERVLGRVDRHRRNRRVGTIVVAIVIAALAVGGSLRAIHRSFEKRPASVTPDNVKDLKVAWKAGLNGSASGLSLRLIDNHKPYHFPTPVVFGPVVDNNVVYITSASGTVSAFSASCAADGGTCEPMWEADTGSTITYQPAVANGMVYVATNTAGLQAFPADCATGGALCSPSWVGAVGAPSSAPVAVGGIVYVLDPYREQLVAFTRDCATGGQTCAPLWSAPAGSPWPSTGPTPSNFPYPPVVADGVAYVVGATRQVYAFDATTGQALWVGRTAWSSIDGPRFSQVAVSDDEVYVQAGPTLYAFRKGCATGGAECGPDWTGGSSDTPFMTEPVVANETVYVGTAANGGTGHVEAFPVDCRRDGAECKPLWVARADGEATTLYPVVAGDRVFVTSAIRGFTDAFEATCSRECSIAWRAAPIPGHGQLGLTQPPLVSNGVVFVGNGTEIRAFDVNCGSGGAACNPLWTWKVPEGIASTPVVAGGELIVATSAGGIYAFVPNSST